MRRLAVAVAVVAVLALVRPAPGAADPPGPQTTYRPPVAGPIVDPFRPPSHPFGAGNRGVDYATEPGTPVAAAGDGEVVFAGPVAGGLHVVVLHPDGVRTSYSFLRAVAVHRGQRVSQGQTVGTSDDRLHFGARVGDTYIDPTRLFAGALADVHLVPDEKRRPASEAAERRALAAGLRGVRRVAAGAWRWMGRSTLAPGRLAVDLELGELRGRLAELGVVVSNSYDTNPLTHAVRVGRAVADWHAQRDNCTPESESAPAAPGKGHIAVLVAGLGSSSDASKQSVTDVDTAGLGYGEGAVVRFSYRGGTSEENPYDGRDTTTDIRVSARHLRGLLQRVAREHPGVPVDIIAHSQGGIVTRQALAQEADAGDPALPTINSIVLLGVPNTGADLATAGTAIGHTTAGYALEKAYAWARPKEFDPSGDSVHQLAETSALLTRLNNTPLPAGVRVTSIGARKDLVVPARHTRLEGANNVIVDFPDPPWTTHTKLPGAAVAGREVALAIAGKPPGCQDLADMVADAVTSEVITHLEDGLSHGAAALGPWVDTRAGFPRQND